MFRFRLRSDLVKVMCLKNSDRHVFVFVFLFCFCFCFWLFFFFVFFFCFFFCLFLIGTQGKACSDLDYRLFFTSIDNVFFVISSYFT